MQSSLLKTVFGALAFAILAASGARADVYARIRGTVTDSSGAVIAQAKITATNLATGVTTTVASGADGNYEFLQLPAPATYLVKAEVKGFRAFQAKGIALELNQIYVLNIPLELGAVTQEVNVEASPTQVETTSIELGTTINGRSIVDLPLNGRDWVQLQQLQPGVVSQSDNKTDNFATNGSQPDQNSFLINGTDNNDLPLNTVLVTPSPDAIA